jgi:membrane protease YdiL (CAAX protease family)
MWCPGVAALITQLVFQRNIRGLGWFIGPFRHLLVSYALPFCYAFVAYGIVWLTGLGSFAPPRLAQTLAIQIPVPIQSPYAFLVVYGLFAATVGVGLSCASALGEEIGWRGLLVPELAQRLPFAATALVSGLVWSIWHWPLILFADYRNPGAPVWFSLVCFTVLVVGISFPFAWLRLKSGSLWTATLLHASHNMFVQGLFTPLTGPTKLTPYVIDEFGLGPALVALLVATLFWWRRGELPTASPSQPIGRAS